MQKMENWAHRLYPKLQFEDFMDRLEGLGGKKDVQVMSVSSLQEVQMISNDLHVYTNPDRVSG